MWWHYTIVLPNCMYIVYQSMNGNINLVFSHYGSPGSKKDVFLKEIRNINRVRRAVRSKFINTTVAVAGDFNVRSSSSRYPILIQEMTKSELSPFFDEKIHTWFPQKKQALTKRPTKIDYIFTVEDIHEISEGERVSADNS